MSRRLLDHRVRMALNLERALATLRSAEAREVLARHRQLGETQEAVDLRGAVHEPTPSPIGRTPVVVSRF